MNRLQHHIEQGNITAAKHPKADLFIYNYTPKVQYDRLWDETTLACRGRILDGNQQVVAVPFRKIFNLEEHPPHEIPNEPFVVTEKVDGSLGILYWLGDQPQIATRGSFMSEQALRATEMLHVKYAQSLPLLERNRTYLFEIIYPENRLVVDYGGEQMLVLLAIMDNRTEQDLPLENIGFPLVKSYDGVQDFRALKALNTPNAEGFVVKFQSGLRVKVKFEEYVRLHRILTQCSNLSIWESLAKGQPLDEILERVPDEFYHWVRKTKIDLEARYASVENECRQALKTFETRKETAEYFQSQRHPAILFSMLDGKDYSQKIWRLIRPVFSKPFASEV